MATGAPSTNTAGNPVAQRSWHPYRTTEYGAGREETQTDRDRRRIEERTNAINAANRANRQPQNQPGSGQMSENSIPSNFRAAMTPRLSAYTNPIGGSTIDVPSTATRLPFRGSTGEEISAFNNPPNPATSVAGTNTIGMTPYGKISSRFAAPDELAQNENPMTPVAGTTDTGVVRPSPQTWEQTVMAKHPQIGILDSPQNKAFRAAHQSATSAGSQFDPHALADTVMANLDTTNTPTDQTAETTPPPSAPPTSSPTRMQPFAAASSTSVATKPAVPRAPGSIYEAGNQPGNERLANWMSNVFTPTRKPLKNVASAIEG